MIYKNEFLNEISFPLGGIGSGSIGLLGNGSFADWEIFNKPDKGSYNGYSHIAVKLNQNDKKYVKILNSDVQKELMGRYEKKIYNGYGFGPSISTMSGFPHFKNCEFNGEFPIANLKFTDEDFPGEVNLTAFNPFIPLDSDNSSIPAAFFEISYQNTQSTAVEFQCAFSLANPYEVSKNYEVKNDNITSLRLVNAAKKEDEVDYGELSLSCTEPSAVQKYWYRGGWQDGITAFWNEFSDDTLTCRNYEESGKCDTCSMMKAITLNPGETAKVRFVVSWHVSNNYNYWDNECNEDLKSRPWKNYYAVLFENSVSSGVYSLKNWDVLYNKTNAFKNELFSSSIDEVFKEAASSTLSVLKSPTVFRLENGEFYGFEGVHEQEGSCEGTCQHVYNYAYALCFLFPDLERSIRNLEFKYATYEDGGTDFRLKLPLGMKTERGNSCVDGQMGCVIKTYREWKISGDSEWLKEVWPTVERIMDYAWSTKNKHKWDQDKDGVLEGRQHHTLDMELFGPSSWLQGFYLAALKSAAEMAEFLGYEKKAAEYRKVFEKGKKWTKENLFNGKYFIHKVDVKDKSITERFDCSDTYWNEETGEIKYQICDGSSIDQLTGQWHANICGLGELFDKKQINTALSNMLKNNFKPSMRAVTNLWRNFALNDESGSIMCDYPENVYKPRIPITYCEECMTGFEYQFAGLLLSEGFKNEALKVVKAVRNRYDGKKRNPWNEIECGNNYARAMASFAILPIISGFIFDLPKKKIGFNPVETKDGFKCIWSLQPAWGNVCINESSVRINIMDGSISLSEIELPFIKNAEELIVDNEEKPFKFENGCMIFDEIKICKYAEINYR